MTRTKWLAVTLVGLLATSAAVLAQVALSPSAAASDDGFLFCFAEIAPREDADATSHVLAEQCFTDTAKASAFQGELESLDGVYVLFTIWEDEDFLGSGYEWYSTTSCEGDYGYNDFNVIGWNDRASSARAGCGRTVALWEHTYQMGSSLNISGYSSSLGIMDDESSSWDMADYN